MKLSQRCKDIKSTEEFIKTNRINPSEIIVLWNVKESEQNNSIHQKRIPSLKDVEKELNDLNPFK